MQFKLFSLILIYGLGCGVTAQELVPIWFKKLPDPPPGLMFGVGYAGKYTTEKREKSAAIDSGLKNLTKQIQVRLKFDIEEIADGRFRLLNPSFRESYEEIHLRTVTKNYSVIDSCITNDGYFVLLAYPANQNLHIGDSGARAWGSRPDWINNLPNEKGFVFGVGMVAKYRSWLRAWYDADEYARFDLGKNLQITAESIFASQRDNRTTIETALLKQSYDLTLKNAAIIARWYDVQNDAYYSLCRAPRP